MTEFAVGREASALARSVLGRTKRRPKSASEVRWWNTRRRGEGRTLVQNSNATEAAAEVLMFRAAQKHDNPHPLAQ